MLLQKLIVRPESVSQQLFEPAFKLAEHRGLLTGGADVTARRRAFTAELHEMLADITVIGQAAVASFAVLLAGRPDSVPD